MRKILVAIVALMTSLSAFAADLDIFLKGGVSISKFNLEESENRMGFAAGFGGKFLISDSKFFLMPELMYAQKGQENDVELSTGDVLISGMFHMIELPVLFGGQFDLPVKDMYIGIGVGPYVSYDYRFNEKSENMSMIKKNNTNAMRLVSHGDLGVALSLEIHYKRLFVFGDYDLGLRDILQGGYNVDQSISHRSMRFGAGYSFPTMSIGKGRRKPQM